MQVEKMQTDTANAWQTANFVGAAFAGKLRKLSSYIKDLRKNKAPKVSKEDFEEKLRAAEKAVKDGT